MVDDDNIKDVFSAPRMSETKTLLRDSFFYSLQCRTVIFHQQIIETKKNCFFHILAKYGSYYYRSIVNMG